MNSGTCRRKEKNRSKSLKYYGFLGSDMFVCGEATFLREFAFDKDTISLLWTESTSEQNSLWLSTTRRAFQVKPALFLV